MPYVILSDRELFEWYCRECVGLARCEYIQGWRGWRDPRQDAIESRLETIKRMVEKRGMAFDQWFESTRQQLLQESTYE